MSRKDVWVLSLILIIFVACYSAEHLDVPDKAEVVPESTPVNSPTPIVIETACELEVERLRIEAYDWRNRYLDYRCECDGDNSYED